VQDTNDTITIKFSLRFYIGILLLTTNQPLGWGAMLICNAIAIDRQDIFFPYLIAGRSGGNPLFPPSAEEGVAVLHPSLSERKTYLTSCGSLTGPGMPARHHNSSLFHDMSESNTVSPGCLCVTQGLARRFDKRFRCRLSRRECRGNTQAGGHMRIHG